MRHHPSLPPALAGIDLQVHAGQVLGVVGSNGSGKSTLARALSGLIELEAGQILGREGREPPRVGLVIQDPAAQLLAVTVADEIAIGPEGAGREPSQVVGIVESLLARHRLGGLWARDPGRLSGGQQQRVAVAAIEACDVDVLVLDEPTAMLDPLGRAELIAALGSGLGERAMLWITQDAEDLAHCHEVLVLDAGVVVWRGPVDSYVQMPEVAETYGLELPVAARIARALDARAAWPRHAPRSARTAALVDALSIGQPHA